MISALLLLAVSLLGTWICWRRRGEDSSAVIPLQLDLRIKIELEPPPQGPPEPKRIERRSAYLAPAKKEEDRWVN
jgi:hypothetical protein